MLRCINRGRWAVTLLLLLVPAVSAVGCGGGGSNSRSSGNPVPAPNPGGSVGALASASTSVLSTVTLGAFQAFKPTVDIADLALVDALGLRDRMFALEADGTVRVLSLAGASPTLDRAFSLSATAFPGGVAAGVINVQDETTALATVSGTGGEAVYVFNPSTAVATTDVTKYDLSAVTVTWPVGTQNSAGTDVGGSALPLTFTAGAALASDKLFVTSSNLAFPNNNPGTVIVYDVNPVTKALSGGTILPTTNFNPSALTRVAVPQGQVLLVTNSGPFGTDVSSIDVIDPVSVRQVASIPLGARKATGPVVVSSDGRRGYVGSQTAPEVYVLDLEGLGGEIANVTSQSRPARYLGGYSLPSAGASNYISSLALSRSGRYLYAVSFNGSELFAIDLANPGVAARVQGFVRGGDPTFYENLASRVVVRPGTPGIDFSGPSIFVGTISLRTADRTITDVKSVLDSVSVDRQ